jgi:hypothetical protein
MRVVWTTLFERGVYGRVVGLYCGSEIRHACENSNGYHRGDYCVFNRGYAGGVDQKRGECTHVE